MYKHILQFFYRLFGSAAMQGFFAIHYEWDILTWLGYTLVGLIIIYLLDILFIWLGFSSMGH